MASTRTIGIAIGAGLASALLFAASAKGAALALVIAYVTPLPIMIAALGFGQATGLLAAGVACAAIALILGILAGGFFGVLVGFPSWWLAYLALLARPLPAAPSGSPPGLPGLLAWYPIGRVMTWGAALVSAVVLAFGFVTLLHFGGFDATVKILSGHLKDVLNGSAAEAPIAESASAIIGVLPSILAGSTFLMLMLNLWLAGRVVQWSGLLSRPWSPLPENLRLPKIAAAVLIVACFGALLGGVLGVGAGVLVGTLGVGFILQGLGAAHALTRGLMARRLILFAIYFITMTIVPSLLALAVLGVVDCLLPLRQKRPPSPSPTNV